MVYSCQKKPVHPMVPHLDAPTSRLLAVAFIGHQAQDMFLEAHLSVDLRLLCFVLTSRSPSRKNAEILAARPKWYFHNCSQGNLTDHLSLLTPAPKMWIWLSCWPWVGDWVSPCRCSTRLSILPLGCPHELLPTWPKGWSRKSSSCEPSCSLGATENGESDRNQTSVKLRYNVHGYRIGGEGTSQEWMDIDMVAWLPFATPQDRSFVHAIRGKSTPD